jgi:hypothetical protein
MTCERVSSPEPDYSTCPWWCDRRPKDHNTDEDFPVIGDPIHKHYVGNLGVHIYLTGADENLLPTLYVPALYNSHGNWQVTEVDAAEQLGQDIIEAAQLLRSIRASTAIAA